VRSLIGVLAVALTLAMAGPATAQSTKAVSQLQHSTGFVVVSKGNGQLGYGTCWVADLERRLLVTNVHVVSTFNDVRVAFIHFDANGQPVTNSSAYTSSDYLAGKVTYRDSKRDLALIQLTSLPRGVQALPLAPQSIEPGQSIFSIGNSGMAGRPLSAGTLWRQRSGKVQKAFFWRTKLNNIDQNLEVRVIQTDSGVQAGDSGGAIVDGQGRLVGVVSCNNAEADFGIDVGEVRTVLQRALGKAPAAPHPAVGTWTVSWSQKGKEYYASLTLNPDGTGLWEGTKQFSGSYAYNDGELTLKLPNSGVNTTNSQLIWSNNNNQFLFSIQYSDGPVMFTAVRR
jgi:S1-C subfamily serine protease